MSNGPGKKKKKKKDGKKIRLGKTKSIPSTGIKIEEHSIYTEPYNPFKFKPLSPPNPIKFAGGRVVRKGLGKFFSTLGIVPPTKRTKGKGKEDLFAQWKDKQVNTPRSERIPPPKSQVDIAKGSKKELEKLISKIVKK